jgi:N-acetylmuramoyl-L-alanine amidase
MDRAEMLSRLKMSVGYLNEIVQSLESAPEPQTPTPTPTTADWSSLIEAIATSDLHASVKAGCMAQAIIETGRGTSDLFLWHFNAHGMKWRDEMQGIAKKVLIKVPSERDEVWFCEFASEANAVAGYLRFLNREPYKGWENKVSSPQSFLRHVCATWASDQEYLKKCLAVLPEAVELLSKYGYKLPQPPRQKKILIDPGHSKSSPGARGRAPDRPSEYLLNVLQAGIIAEKLRQAGHIVEIYDPAEDNLSMIGRRAVGHDLFLSLHHNAANADGRDEGTETYITTPRRADDLKMASAIQAAIVKALGSKDRGVKEKSFTVISSARSVCPIAILVESYFIDDYGDAKLATARSTASANAIAKAILETL